MMMTIEEKRELRKQILSETRPGDWTQYNDRLSLKPKGAIKIGHKFNVTLKGLLQTKENQSDGHYSYVFQGTFSSELSPVSIDAYGLACSRKAKYSRKGDTNSLLIDEKKVAYDAYLDLWKNGITILFCLNNVIPAEFSKEFISQVNLYEYGKKS